MTYRLLISFFLLLSLQGWGQEPYKDPVKWSCKTQKTGKGEMTLYIKAKIKPGWILYAVDCPTQNGYPLTTSINNDNVSGVRLKSFRLLSKVKEKPNDLYNDINFRYYERKFELQEVLVYEPGHSYNSNIDIYYMPVNDKKGLVINFPGKILQLKISESDVITSTWSEIVKPEVMVVAPFFKKNIFTYYIPHFTDSSLLFFKDYVWYCYLIGNDNALGISNTDFLKMKKCECFEETYSKISNIISEFRSKGEYVLLEKKKKAVLERTNGNEFSYQEWDKDGKLIRKKDWIFCYSEIEKTDTITYPNPLDPERDETRVNHYFKVIEK